MIKINSIDYNTLVEVSGDERNDYENEEDEEDVDENPNNAGGGHFSFFGMNTASASGDNNNNSKTALGFDTLTKQVSGKYFPTAKPNNGPMKNSDLDVDDKSDTVIKVDSSNVMEVVYNKKKESGKDSVSMVVEDGYLRDENESHIDTSMDSSTHSIDNYKIGDDSVGIYKSYVAINRYKDVCYENDSDEKIFDVTGLRKQEIENYNATYSTPEEFLFESKERSDYYNAPERIMKDYMKNLLIEEY